MDTGRWEKEVVTSEGVVWLVLSLPDVQEPPMRTASPERQMTTCPRR
jgi:hypothetical protein